MDPKDKQIAELTTKLAEAVAGIQTAQASITKLETGVKTLTDSNTKLGKDIEVKDKLIDTQKSQITGQRRKLSERTKEELDEMTEAEKEAIRLGEQNADETKARLDKIEAEGKKAAERERTSRIDTALARYTNKPDIQAAIRKNLERLADFPTAMTTQEIEDGVKMAINMLGTAAPSGLRDAISSAGSGEAPGSEPGQKKNFADTPAGQEMLKRIMPTAVGPLTDAQKEAESKMAAPAPASAAK